MSQVPSLGEGLLLNRSELLTRGAVGALGVGALGMIGCGGDSDQGDAAGAASRPSRPTGTLRVGVLNDATSASFDPDTPSRGMANGQRIALVNDRLFEVVDRKVRMRLAESAEPSSDTRIWDVTLRDGLEFHDGKPIRPEDLIFSFERRKDPKGDSSAIYRQIEQMKKTGPRTVRLTFASPRANFLEAFSNSCELIPEDFDPKNPNGSGPFKRESDSVFVPHPNWWGEGPFVERLELQLFSAEAARLNALLANQIDAIDAIASAQLRTIKGRDGFETVTSASENTLPILMNLNNDPFSDNRVRTAFCLIANREQMNQQVYDGLGKIGNDIVNPFDPAYSGDELPQREQDIEQAKSLLKSAGKENLTVTIDTAPIGSGAVESAQVFVEQAKAAGVTLKIKQHDPQAYWTDATNVNTRSLSSSYLLGGSGYLNSAEQMMVTGAVMNVVGFSSQRFDSLYKEAMSTSDDAKRTEMIAEMQRIEYDSGAWLIWAYPPNITAFNSKVRGVKPRLDAFGGGLDYPALWIQS